MRHCRSITSFRDSFRFLLPVWLLLVSSAAHAEVCVWRNPERTMTRIFPDAGDYKTIIKGISGEKKGSIEKRLGAPLDPGESKEWMYYEIMDGKGSLLGYIIADAEKGEMGIIEIVMGITPDGKVVSVYVQRARERDKEFKSDEFLKQFTGKNVKAHVEIGNDIKAAADSTSVRAVVFGVRKMLVFYDELKTEKSKEDE